MVTATDTRTRPRILRCFAELLEYPQRGLESRLKEGERLLQESNPQAAAGLTRFRKAVHGLSSERLEEIYTGTFDLDARCHPYIGHQLLGETYKRSLFLVRLKECYREHGFQAPSNELPDHLAVMLRFLSEAPDSGTAHEIVAEALIPALEGMLREAQEEAAPEGGEAPPRAATEPSPYQELLRALLAWLREAFNQSFGEAAGNAGNDARFD